MEPLTPAQKELYDWLVDYICQHQYSPSIRQMMQAMNLKSPAPVQSRLEHLRNKGYIAWTEGRARTIRILHPAGVGLPVLGAIAAGGLIEPFTEAVEQFDLTPVFRQPQYFALRVTGDSMIDALITEGDVVIMRPADDPKTVVNGAIVAARVEDQGTTLKHYYRKGSRVTLKPANPKYEPIEVPGTQVQIQGVLVGVWRGYGSSGAS
jgi:repressor LexA